MFKACIILGGSHHVPFPMVDRGPAGEAVVDVREGSSTYPGLVQFCAKNLSVTAIKY